MRNESLTWEEWRGHSDDAVLTGAGHRVLTWAVDVVRDLLGETWLRDNAVTSGHVPLLAPERWPLANLRAFTRLIELAVRTTVVRQLPAAAPLLEQARQIHPNREAVARKFADLCLTLETAAFAITDGWDVTYERPLPSGRKPDLSLHRAGLDVLMELTILDVDRDFRTAEAWSDRTRDVLRALEHRYRVDIVYRVEQIVGDDETNQWFTAVEAACRLTAADATTHSIDDGNLSAEIYPAGLRPDDRIGDGPVLDGDLWKRVEARLRDKARQTTGGPPAWIRIDETGVMFYLTDWSARSLPDRLAALQHNIDLVLADAPHVRGVILTSGDRAAGVPVTPQTVWPCTDSLLPPSRERLALGPVAVHRSLPGGRQRLTFVVPTRHPYVVLPAGTGLEPGRWYDDEPRWLDRTLVELGHPPAAALVAAA